MPGLELAQVAGPAPTPPHTGFKALLKNLVDDAKHLPSKENALWAGVGGVAALAVHPADEAVNQAMVNSSFAHDFFKPGAVIGALPTLFGSAIAVYAVGQVRDQPKVSHTGMDLIQSLLLSEGLVQGLKFATQRERPDGTPRAFPSGHASNTFAFATALERHLGWRFAVPAYTRLMSLFHGCQPIATGSARRVWIDCRHHRRPNRDATRTAVSSNRRTCGSRRFIRLCSRGTLNCLRRGRWGRVRIASFRATER